MIFFGEPIPAFPDHALIEMHAAFFHHSRPARGLVRNEAANSAGVLVAG